MVDGATGDEWERRDAEPALWFGRFCVYLGLGPGRSVDAAYRVDAGRTDGRAGATWRKAALRWEWAGRADAFDAAEIQRLRAADEERRRVARERRIEILQLARDQAWTGIQKANLSELDESTARYMIGSLRLLLVEAMKGERLEMGEPTEILAESGVAPFRADELAAAQEELRRWREGRTPP